MLKSEPSSEIQQAAPHAAPAALFRSFMEDAALKGNRVYIAGPMTGLPDLNFPAFNFEAALLRNQGLHVENPAEHGTLEGAEWGDYLRYDIGRLATCGAIYLLKGWENSKGAQLEVHIARTLGMAFMYAPGAMSVLQAEAAPAVPTYSIDDMRDARRESYSAGVASAVPQKVTADMRRVFREAFREGGFWADRLDYALGRMLAAAPQPEAAMEPKRLNRWNHPPLDTALAAKGGV